MIYRILAVILMSLPRQVNAQVYEVSEGKVDFHSNAPQELIHAWSNQLRGVVNIEKKIFAFRIAIISFSGFNSPLQREHFNENYMETSAYPDAAFTGKIIENVDLRKDGDYTLRAKGRLRIHGVELERIIYVKARVKDQKINVVSTFSVPLTDHNIKIPRVVYDKLSNKISISVVATLSPK
jgi:hypothetical protein